MKRSAEVMKAAVMLSSTLNQSIAKLREKMADGEKADFQGFEAQLKAAMLRARM